MTFDVGDAVFHPLYGAGVVIDIKERHSLGSARRYYSVDLLCQPKTLLMVPVQSAAEIGLRRSLPQSGLKRVWGVLRAEPSALPIDHGERYELLKDKLYGGDTLQIATVLRDLAWREQTERRLTKQDKHLYEEGLNLLASEAALAQSSDFADAETQVSSVVKDSVASRSVV